MPSEMDPLEYVLERMKDFQHAVKISQTTEQPASTDLPTTTAAPFHCHCRRCPRCGGYIDDYYPPYHRDYIYPYYTTSNNSH